MAAESVEIPKLTKPDHRGDKDSRSVKGRKHASTTKIKNKDRPPATWRETLRSRKAKFDEQGKQIYLAHLAKTNRKTESAEKAEVAPSTVSRHKASDPEFAERVKIAEAAYIDDFVGHHHNLARNGTPRRKYDRAGNMIEEWTEWPIPLILVELKKIDAGYRERQSIDLNQTSAGVLLAPVSMTPEDWMAAQNAKNESKEAPVSTKEDSEGENQGKPALAIKAA